MQPTNIAYRYLKQITTRCCWTLLHLNNASIPERGTASPVVPDRAGAVEIGAGAKWASVRQTAFSLVPYHELLEKVVGLGEGLHRRQQNRPEVALTELLAEPGSVDHDDSRLVHEVEDEVLVGLPGVGVDPDEGVQRTAGHLTGEPGDLVDPLVGEVGPLLELAVHVDDVVLRSGKGDPCRLLAGHVGADPRTELLHHALL